MTILFVILAVIAFIGFAVQSALKNGHGMAYSAAICIFWLLAAAYWSGRLG